VKTNILKRMLRDNNQIYCSWVTIGHPLIPEILAPAGFHALVVDMEHSSITLKDLLMLIISIENNGMVPLVRVGENNANLIKRVMDAGAYGVIVPNICAVEDVTTAINSVKYPPSGTRGVGLYRAHGYGKKFNEYLHWLESESMVIIQIEHIDAVKKIDEILSVPGIDAFFIGPYDLSGSMDKPGEFDDKEVEEAIHTVLEAGKKYNIPAGFHSVPSDWNEANKYRDQGFKILGFSVDSIFLGDAASSAMGKLKRDE